MAVSALWMGASRAAALPLPGALGEQEDALRDRCHGRRCPDLPGCTHGSPYRHELIWADDTPDGKQSMAVYRRELGLRIRPARKSNMRRLSYEWLAGLREIVIDPVRCPLAYEEFRLKEFERDRDGTWIDKIPDGNDHSIDTVRYAMMDDVLRGA
jgi:hypothetical protein